MKLGGSNSVVIAPSSSKSPYVEVITRAITDKKSLTIQYQSLVLYYLWHHVVKIS